MIVYIDSKMHCHFTNPDGNYRAFDVPFFDGKCKTFIEGFIYVPIGESLEGSDGTVYHGEMRTAWKPYDELDAAQREYERQKLADAEAALAILLGGVV